MPLFRKVHAKNNGSGVFLNLSAYLIKVWSINDSTKGVTLKFFMVKYISCFISAFYMSKQSCHTVLPHLELTRFLLFMVVLVFKSGAAVAVPARHNCIERFF